MAENKLKLNSEKKELLILSEKFGTEPIFPVLNVGSDTITPSSHARNIGRLINFLRFLQILIMYVSQHFITNRIFPRVRRYLTVHTTEQLGHAFVTVKLDNNNALLYGLPKEQTGSYNEF